MIDQLDSLSDDELAEKFVVKVLNWTQCLKVGLLFKDTEGCVQSLRQVHRFTKSADAVIEVLEAYEGGWSYTNDGLGGPHAHEVCLSMNKPYSSRSMPRAACIALILSTK